MKQCYLTLLSLLLFFGFTGIRLSAQPNDKPNILFILIDDMGWKDVGCYGSTYYDTPRIDRLASEGVRFLNAYSAAPVCTPSRGAIFSGKSPGRTKLTTVFKGKAGPDDRLFDVSKYQGGKDQYLEARHRHALLSTEFILPQALAAGGYKTGFFGKWHCGDCPDYYPDERGFEVAKGYRKSAAFTKGHFGAGWAKGNFANMADPDPKDFIPDVLTDECVNFIRENRERPFFAMLSHYIVHSPVTPRLEKVPKYEKRAATDQSNAKYAALVESVDDSVGRLLDTLAELKLEQNTLVIFTSDNGGLTPRNTSNYPLMGGKSFPFEAGMRVPFIAKWPGKIKPGVSSERIIGTDLYPTFLAAAGLPMRPAQHVDGVNLLPLLTKNIALKKRPLVFHFPHYTHATGPFSSIFEDDQKLIRFYNDAEGAYLLYDLAQDPQEQNNLTKTNPELQQRLAGRLALLLKEMQAELPRRNPAFNPNIKSKRKHLKFTKGLAEKERRLFESRLSK